MEYGLVLDASAGVALALSEEEGPGVEAAIEDAVCGGLRAIVPPLFWYEVGNALLIAARRGRIAEVAAVTIVEELAQLPIDTDRFTEADTRRTTCVLASEHALSYYDAAYLELALRAEVGLITFNRHLLALKHRYEFIV